LTEAATKDSNGPPVIALAAVGVTAAIAVTLALCSLRWPLMHDLPIFLYDGFMMADLGRVPYRDFYEINAPGTMFIYEFLHVLTDGDDLALRLFDLTVLAGISGFTILALRPHGVRAGVLASACYAIAYFAEGPGLSLQREYLSLLPLSASMAIVFRLAREARPWLAMLVIGALAGAVGSVKPPLMICWIPLALLVFSTRFAAGPRTLGTVVKEGVSVFAPFAVGVLIPFAAIAWTLAQSGALEPYLDIAANYYPLYAELDGGGKIRHLEGVGLLLRRYVGSSLQLFSDFRFVLVSFAGLVLAWSFRGRAMFPQFVTICGLVVAGLLYVSIGGKFWIYHSFPLYYGLALVAGTSVSRAIDRSASETRWIGICLCFALLVAIPLNKIGHELRAWRSGSTHEVKDGRVDLVAKYLKESTRPDESVMALDVTSGALHGLYRARRPLHGPVIYDFHVYHHIDEPYIKGLRRTTLSQFDGGGPDLIVKMDNTWLRKSNFPELDEILTRDYEVVMQENGVSILRRRER
jgi:hypothetical protein